MMDIESTNRFLLEQQARYKARPQEFELAIAKINEMLLQASANLAKTTAAQDRTSEILARLAEQQIKTENALRSLSPVVERHLDDLARK